MSWGTVLKLLVLAIGLRVVWGWAIDEADDPPMEVWSGAPAVPTTDPDWDEWQAIYNRYTTQRQVRP